MFPFLIHSETRQSLNTVVDIPKNKRTFGWERDPQVMTSLQKRFTAKLVILCSLEVGPHTFSTVFPYSPLYVLIALIATSLSRYMPFQISANPPAVRASSPSFWRPWVMKYDVGSILTVVLLKGGCESHLALCSSWYSILVTYAVEVRKTHLSHRSISGRYTASTLSWSSVGSKALEEASITIIPSITFRSHCFATQEAILA